MVRYPIHSIWRDIWWPFLYFGELVIKRQLIYDRVMTGLLHTRCHVCHIVGSKGFIYHLKLLGQNWPFKLYIPQWSLKSVWFLFEINSVFLNKHCKWLVDIIYKVCNVDIDFNNFYMMHKLGMWQHKIQYKKSDMNDLLFLIMPFNQ